MKTARFISHLENLGIRLWLDENHQLRYQAPKNALTDDLRTEITDHKAEIITFLSQAGQDIPDTFIRPVARNGSNGFPLSFSQQRLWFLSQLDDVNDVYNIPGEYRIHGPLDVALLEESFRTIEVRHEALRTTFLQEQGEVYQRINPPEFRLAFTDLSDLPEEQKEAEILRLSRQSANYAFDLEKGPLWRAHLLRLDSREHLLLLTMHHIISDGWSMGIMMHELSTLYAENGDRLPDLPIQYPDFSVWQREWLSGDVLDEQTTYWENRLAEAPPLLTLPTDHPRPPVQSDRGDHLLFSLSEKLTGELKALSRKNHSTLFMTLQAAFAVLMSRYSGQTDICIGTPIANRQFPEIENLIGLFLNALVLRNNLSGNPSFLNFLARVRHVALNAYQHQALPFEVLVETLQPERSLSHSPIFQVMFNLLNNRQDDLSLPGLSVEFILAEYPVAKHDLMLSMQEREGALSAMFEYSTDLFERATIEHMAGHFLTLLEGIVADPDQPVSILPMLTGAERRQILVEWNDIRADRPDECYHELFEAQVENTPDAAAVIHQPFSDKDIAELTYGELNARANQLAHHLRTLGVGASPDAEVIVGVCMERSPETVITLLAIFKAGGVYIPLDPSLPKERLSYMLTKSDARIILAKSPYTHLLQDADARIICLDTSKSFLGKQSEKNPVNVSTPRNLAYVLFTSGSTGLPKGVMIEHRGMVNNLFAKIEDHGMTSADKLAQTAPPSFDISIWQFLAALLTGGTVRIFDDDTARDPVRLLERTEAEKITILEVVPSLFRFMLDEVESRGGSGPGFSALRWLSLTGEALPPKLCNEWFARYPDIPIMNAYGPAECSDDSTHHAIHEPLPTDAVNVPIGRVIPNVRLYVLDGHMRPVPVGVPGELHVGGIGVGRGYLNDPERTAESFMEDPFAPEPDARLYKTGDVVRYRPDGTLEFLGRLDNQVKLRGFRIEPGEIEALLDRHEAVEKAVAVIQTVENGEKQLVGYVTVSQDGKTQTGQVLLQDKQVRLWRDLHEQSYQERLLLDGDETLNVIGWDSNYTNSPLPAIEMHEYIDGAIRRALAGAPRRILEVGCGTGLLAFRLIPEVESYYGVDISEIAIRQLKALQADPAVQARTPGLENAVFEVGSADDVSGLTEERFDLVMLPSVVQYFPSLEYLNTVLKNLSTLVRDGGRILISDVRHLGLLEAFHASVLLYKSDDDDSSAAMKEHLGRQMQNEQEMAVDPVFFVEVARALPRVAHVEVLPKPGLHHNEMTRFRYDVRLYLGGESATDVTESWHDWAQTPMNPAQIEKRLLMADRLALRRVKNRRVETALAGLEWIGQAAADETVSRFRQREMKNQGLEPEELTALGEKTGHRVCFSLAGGEKDGAFDVLFGRDLPERVFMPAPETKGHTAWRQYANNPLREKQERLLVPQWREYLNKHLPGYMVPNRFVLLDKMPLTPNGKIDRNRLPVPDNAQRVSSSGYTMPRTQTEEILVDIWQRILRIDRIGIEDNFFEIGGHSLLATQVVSHIRKKLQVELPLRRIFSAPTIAELADYMEKLKVSQAIQKPVEAGAAAREEIAI